MYQPNAPSESEVEDALGEAVARVADNDHRFPGMTYEEGIRDALAWVTGESDDNPLEPYQ